MILQSVVVFDAGIQTELLAELKDTVLQFVLNYWVR